MAGDEELANAATTMATPQGRPAAPLPLETVDGARYTNRKELSRGGMGKIVTAFDVRLRRTVAIKEIRGSDADLVARFEREIMLSAKLEHPAIVTIHDAGVWPSGEPFYVMRLVPGRSLATEIERAPDLRKRLALVPHVIAVADALAYAHGQRVIHRDLKPGNVMIGEFGETVVIDWGLAKELSASRASSADVKTPVPGETQLGDVLGTPAYMPPEQALGAPTDERADVYAIGAILYHVLAGRAPYEGATTEVLDSVKRGAATPLDTLVPDAPSDLLAIVRRAMARAAADRYPSARELADDLRAFQAGRLVGAHRYTAGELFRRWLRRYRVAIGVGAIAAVALVGIGAASVYRIVQARTQADRNRQQAERLVNFIVHDLNDKLLPSGQSDLMFAAVQKAAEYYAARPPESASEREAYGEFLNTYGRILLGRGDTAGALRELRASQRLVAQLQSSGAQVDSLEVQTLGALGAALQASGDLDGAATVYRDALSVAERRAAREPSGADWNDRISISRARLGELLQARGDFSGARAQMTANLDLATTTAAAHPDDHHALRNLILAHDNLGLLEVASGHADAALAHYRAEQELLATMSARNPDDPQPKRDLALVQTHVGGVLSDRDDLAGALAEYRAGTAADEAALARDPENAVIQSDLADNVIGAGKMLMAQKQLDPARAQFERAIAIVQPLSARDPDNANWAYQLSTAQVALGDVLSGRDHAGALAAYRAAESLRERLAARSPADVKRQQGLGYVHEAIGEELVATGDKTGAKAELDAALAIYERLAAADPNNARAAHAIAKIRESLSELQKP